MGGTAAGGRGGMRGCGMRSGGRGGSTGGMCGCGMRAAERAREGCVDAYTTNIISSRDDIPQTVIGKWSPTSALSRPGVATATSPGAKAVQEHQDARTTWVAHCCRRPSVVGWRRWQR